MKIIKNIRNSLRKSSIKHRARQEAVIREQMKLQDTYYRDVLDIVTGAKTLRHNDVIVLHTDFPVAYESLDHLHPYGTMQDNTRNYAFYKKCLALFGENMTFLDIGCAGGGIVFDFALHGHLAIGLEGSDFSQKRGRANWRTIPNNLFTCDVTKTFSLTAKNSKNPYAFDVISAWEVFEHIEEKDLPLMLENVRKHMSKNSIFVGSISRTSKDPLHVTVKEPEWWKTVFKKNGFEMNTGYDDVFEFHEYCRGIKGGLFDSHDYQTTPADGFHFVARLK